MPTFKSQIPQGENINWEVLDKAIEYVESRGRRDAVSPKGALGPMQTMPRTLADPGYGVRPASDPNDPDEQARVGRDYIRGLAKHYEGDLFTALAAYNYGPGNVNKWRARGADFERLPRETRNYIPSVIQTYHKYLKDGVPELSGTGGTSQTRPTPELSVSRETPVAAPDKTATNRMNYQPVMDRLIQMSPEEIQSAIQESTNQLSTNPMVSQQATPRPPAPEAPIFRSLPPVGADAPPQVRHIDDWNLSPTMAGGGLPSTDKVTGQLQSVGALKNELPPPMTAQQRATEAARALWQLTKAVGPPALGVWAGNKYLLQPAKKAIKEYFSKGKDATKTGGKTGALALLDVGTFPLRRNAERALLQQMNDMGGEYRFNQFRDIIDAEGTVVMKYDEVRELLENISKYGEAL